MTTAGAGGQPDFEEREVSLREYLDVLHRRRWIIAAAFLVTLGTAVGLSLSMPYVYRASTTVTTDKSPPVVLMEAPGKFSLFADQAAAQAPDVFTLAELVKSETVREGAAARLEPLLGREAARKLLEKGLSVQQVRNTEIVRINVEHTDPRVAAAAANAVAQSLTDMNLKTRRRRVTETREFIENQLAGARDRLRTGEQELVEFKNRFGEVSLAQETTLLLQKMADLRAQLVDVGLQRRETQTRAAAARERLGQQAKVSPTQWTPSPLITMLQNQLATLEVELAGLLREFTPRHPSVTSTRAKIQALKQRLEAEMADSMRVGTYGVDPVYQQLIQEVARAEMAMVGLDERERALNAVIADYARMMQGVPARETELAGLTRTVKEAEAVYLLLSEKYQDARIAETSIGSAIRVVDPARVPEDPVKPRRRLNTLLGAVLGLMLGAVAAFVVEQLDDTVKSVDEVERVLGAPVLGAIPLLDGAAPGNARGEARQRASPLPILDPSDRRSPAAEAYRALRTHVLFSMPDVQRKCLLVTSALQGEGKSTIAANLALAIARTDRQVWLVDGDLRRSTLDRMFPEADSPGLASFLAGQAESGDIVKAAPAPNLWFVAAGPTVPNPAELLGARRMATLMDEARAKADVVVMDSPPVLPVTDAEVAGAQADGALLVVKAGQTERRALAHARQRLERVGVRVIGAVLNCVPAGRQDGYYYSTYYYGYYGHYGDDDDKNKKESDG